MIIRAKVRASSLAVAEAVSECRGKGEEMQEKVKNDLPRDP